MAKATGFPVRQTLSKVRSVASIREPRPKKTSKSGRRVSAVSKQLIEKIDAINEEGRTLSYASEEKSKQEFPLWVANHLISNRDVPSHKRRISIAKQAIQRARKMKKLNGITYVSDGSGGFGVYSQAHLLRKECMANHPSTTGAIRVAKAEVAA